MSKGDEEDWLTGLVAALGERAESGASLATYSTYRVGGPARLLVRVESLADLEAVHRAVEYDRVPILIVGRGSNLLVSDRGFPGLVVHLGGDFGEFSFAPVSDGGTSSEVTAGGAVLLPVLARQCVRSGWSGLEWMVGIPGSVGGAVRMNAGGHGSDVSQSLIEATVFDLAAGEIRQLTPHELDLDYRGSNVAASEVVVSARFALKRGDVDESLGALGEIVSWRRENQPGGANGGSVFANPAGASAGALIDKAGGKGLRVGGASVSTKHANFILVDEGGAAEDVYRLIRKVQDLVARYHGVDLKAENVMVGF